MPDKWLVDDLFGDYIYTNNKVYTNNKEEHNSLMEPLSTNHWEVGKPLESCRRHPHVLSVCSRRAQGDDA